MEDIVMNLQSLLFMNLVNDSPILSGNMQSMIQCGLTTPSQAEIVIEAPFYDHYKWKKDKVIVHTGETKKGYTDYASLVNEAGGFGTHNKSEHWVNRTILASVEAIANMIGATIINKVAL